jgi:thiol-disulfide isomerase/thioredoxin
MKKYIKEATILALMVLVVTNIIGFYKASSIEAKSSFKILLEQKSIDGTNLKTLLLQNKPLVLNFWGSWCPVCNQEISTINKIAKDKSIILITVAVNSGEDKDIKAFMQSKNANFLVINDNSGTIAKSFNITTYPTTIFYSPNREKTIKDSGYLSYMGYLARKKIVE